MIVPIPGHPSSQKDISLRRTRFQVPCFFLGESAAAFPGSRKFHLWILAELHMSYSLNSFKGVIQAII